MKDTQNKQVAPLSEACRDSIRALCHTLNNKLIAVAGFSELMLQENIDTTQGEKLARIHGVTKSIASMTEEVSVLLRALSEETEYREQQKISARVVSLVCAIKSKTDEVRPALESLLQDTHTSSDAQSYKEKAVMAVEQLQKVAAQLPDEV